MACPVEMTTAQGYDLQVGTNVIGSASTSLASKSRTDTKSTLRAGHHLLTMLLLPALEAASAPGHKARVVTSSSIVQYRIDRFHFEWVEDGPVRRSVDAKDLYKNSKFVSFFLRPVYVDCNPYW